MTRSDLVVVMPVYNEAEIIDTVLKDWITCLKNLEINFLFHVYNDGSKDNTLSVLKDFAKTNPEVVIHDKPNSGHGPTILKGYTENNHAKWLFQIDSDNEISAKYFSSFWKDREDYDFLVGYRNDQKRPLARKFISWFSKKSIDLFYGSGIKDVNIPYRLMRTSMFEPHIKTIPPDTFAPNVIISGIAMRHRFRIKQYPVNYTNRQTGEVSIKKFKLFKSAVKSFIQTIRYRFGKKHSNPTDN